MSSDPLRLGTIYCTYIVGDVFLLCTVALYIAIQSRVPKKGLCTSFHFCCDWISLDFKCDCFIGMCLQSIVCSHKSLIQY